MKKIFIILGLFLTFTTAGFAYQETHLQKNNYSNYNYPIAPVYRTNYRPIYNSYNNPYYSPYNYRRINANDIRRLNRLKKIRRMNRNYWNNFLTWNNKKNNQGAMTGYSVPVTKDVYDQMGISPYDPKTKQKTNSPTCRTDLFSSPSGDEMYYSNGEKRVNLGGTSGKTGVTIIYD